MNQAKKVPKFRKKKQVSTKKDVLVEPTRTSIYNVLLKNFKAANRTIYVHRLIYIGQHIFDTDEEGIVTFFQKNVKDTNSGYCPEPLTGILLYYERFFCHIVESSEEMLFKHLDLLFKDKEFEMFSNMKVLSVVHHIKRRFVANWIHYLGHPPIRVEEIDAKSDLENSMRYIKNCGEKLYKFANEFIAEQARRDQATQEQQQQQQPQTDRISVVAEAVPMEQRRTTRVSIVTQLIKRDPFSENLPELKLLQFIVNCKHLKDLEEYYKSYGDVNGPNNFYSKAWPTPSTLVPYNVFDRPFDPIEDLPTGHGGPKDDVDIFDTGSNTTVAIIVENMNNE